MACKDDNPLLQAYLKGHKKPVTSLSFSSDDKQFASSGEDNSIVVWHTKEENKRSYSFEGHNDIVTDVQYAHNGSLLASCSKDSYIRLWVPTIRGNSTHFKGDVTGILTLSFSPDDSKLATGCMSKAIKIWDTSTHRFITSLVGHNNWIRCVKYSKNEKVIVSCSDDRTIRVWDTTSGECVHTFSNIKNSSPTYVSIHRNSNSIAVGMNSGTIRIYDIRANKLQQHYKLHEETTGVDFHPKANYLLTSGTEGRIIIVDIIEGRPLYTLSGHEGPVLCAKFNSDGSLFASGGNDCHLMLWKTNFVN